MRLRAEHRAIVSMSMRLLLGTCEWLSRVLDPTTRDQLELGTEMLLYNAARATHQIFDGPLVRPVRVLWHRQKFLTSVGAGSYFGVFGSFAEARAWLPRSREFDLAALAAEYVDVRSKKVFEYDYPVMQWLDRAFQSGATSVLDIGGSVGVHYYAYRRYLNLPANLAWRVVEVPTMVTIGRSLSFQSGATALSFTHDMHHALMADANDIWLSAGAIHYFEDSRPKWILQLCVTRPKHILLNKLPLYDGDDFVTTQNIGEGSFAPLHVYNRTRFIHEIEELGYTLWDQWPVHERSLYLPGCPERSISTFSGLYFVDSASIPEASTPPSG